ncbi:hypothetical protein GQ457_13G030360 [Hibiscus cannabinus]
MAYWKFEEHRKTCGKRNRNMMLSRRNWKSSASRFMRRGNALSFVFFRNSWPCPEAGEVGFPYDSGLAVGKGASSSAAGGSGAGFKALEEALPSSKPTDSSANQSSSARVPCLRTKPHSANDAWRKLHSDPLLMIRQCEQKPLPASKNNPAKWP